LIHDPKSEASFVGQEDSFAEKEASFVGQEDSFAKSEAVLLSHEASFAKSEASFTAREVDPVCDEARLLLWEVSLHTVERLTPVDLSSAAPVQRRLLLP
jgi:hypothetical protein